MLYILKNVFIYIDSVGSGGTLLVLRGRFKNEKFFEEGLKVEGVQPTPPTFQLKGFLKLATF